MAQVQKQTVSTPATIAKHVSAVDEVSFSHDSALVASSSRDDNTVMVWSAKTGYCTQQLKCPGETVDFMVFSHDSSLVASFSNYQSPVNGHVCIWETDTGHCSRDFSVSTSHHTALTFSHDLKLFAVRSGRSIDLWHMGKGTCIRTFEGDDRFDPVVFPDNSSFLGAATHSGTVSLWDIETGERHYKYCIPDARITRIAFSHDLTLMAIATASEDIHIIRRYEGERIQTIKASARADSLVFTNDASFIAAEMGWRAGIFVWRIDTGQLIHKMHFWSVSRCLTVNTIKKLVLSYASGDGQNSELEATNHRYCGYGLSSDGRWITWGEHKLLRLPKTHETHIMMVNDATIVLGYESGRVIILATSTEKLPDLAHTA